LLVNTQNGEVIAQWANGQLGESAIANVGSLVVVTTQGAEAFYQYAYHQVIGACPNGFGSYFVEWFADDIGATFGARTWNGDSLGPEIVAQPGANRALRRATFEEMLQQYGV
jgi:hypothetical protein